MSPEIQSVAALVVVAVAAAWLGWRLLAKRKTPGCGSDCGCAGDALKQKLKR